MGNESNQLNDVLSKGISKFLSIMNLLNIAKGIIEAVFILTMWSIGLHYSRRGFEVVAMYLITKLGIEFSKFRKDLNRMDDTLLKLEYPELFRSPKLIKDSKDKKQEKE